MLGLVALPIAKDTPFQFGVLHLTHSLTYAEKINPLSPDAVVIKTLYGVLDGNGGFVACPLIQPVTLTLDKATTAALKPNGDILDAAVQAALDALPVTSPVVTPDVPPLVIG